MNKNISVKLYLVAAAALSNCLGWAQPAKATGPSDPTPARIEAQQFVGPWRIPASDSVVLIRLFGTDELGVRGQDRASVWDARCVRTSPSQFTCKGFAEKFPDTLFVFHSTMHIVDGQIVDTWSVDGRTADGKLDTAGGTDRLERIVGSK